MDEQLLKELDRIIDGLRDTALMMDDALQNIAECLNDYAAALEKLSKRCEKCETFGAN